MIDSIVVSSTSYEQACEALTPRFTCASAARCMRTWNCSLGRVTESVPEPSERATQAHRWNY